MTEKKQFLPDWLDEAPREKSYRSIFKFGDPQAFHHPNPKMYRALKRLFNLTDEHFVHKVSTGNEPLDMEIPTGIHTEHIEVFQKIVGKENVTSETYDRIKFSIGQAAEEVLKLRNHQIEKIADLVVHPRNKQEVGELVAYCNEHLIPVYVYGGGSSVTLGLTPTKGGVTIVLSTHLNKIVEVNELNQTVTVQAGMLGPALEDELNNARKRYGAKNDYTCGHFPQSFLHSSVGGWFVTLGSGQQSTYYGDAVDMVVAIEVITPEGTIKTHDVPATASGPKVVDIFAGSEGIFGIVVELTWKIFRYQPENRRYMGFIFPNWDSAVEACREISQGEFGLPAVLRISDPEETDFAFAYSGFEGSLIDTFITLIGYQRDQRCLCLATADGAKSYTKNVHRQVKSICKKFGTFYLGGSPAKIWEKGRFSVAEREDLMDYGLIIDTLETSVKWDNLHQVYKEVRNFVKSRPNTMCSTHASHFYPQGTNLYFIFSFLGSNLPEYLAFQQGIIKVMVDSGGTPSHHHGVGRLAAPVMEAYLGNENMEILKALKRHFDPNNIMNPGGILGIS
jgi:alkyldihydroxyacetonephosphate synthase